MQLSRMDLNLFVVFDVIYRERNLTRAADALHITQPAVSNALNRLRQSFNDKLFIRRSGQMVPTPLAENIIERVRTALINFESCFNEHDDFDPASSTRHFSFAMNDTSESYLLPLLMDHLQEHAPNIYIESYGVARKDLTREFAAGELDFALDVPLVNDPQLTHKPIVNDRYICVARKGHPDLEDGMDLEKYLTLPHIHISSRRTGQGYIDLHLNRLGLQRNIKLRVQHSRAAPPIVANTNMIMTIPETLAEEHNELEAFQLPFALPNIDWHLYWPTNYTNDKAHRWMRNVIFNMLGHTEK